ncbi:MAG: hypothetical protein ABIK65_14555 [Candidatus Eisenbacteria bacterium]
MRTIHAVFTGIFLAGCLLASCSSENAGSAKYVSYGDPDNLLLNMERAWKNRDLSEYRDRILYGGKTTGRSGLLHRPFTYYSAKGGDPDSTKPLYGFDQEVDMAAAMFGKRPSGPDKRTVSSLDLVVERLDDWKSVPAGKEVLGDPCPGGTETCRIRGVLRLTLAPEEPGGEDDLQSVHHNGRIYVIPVKSPDPAEGPRESYRLWKWVDFGE